jgi:UDP-N-acetyl-D-mannosaminuronic acid dehydrogenase
MTSRDTDYDVTILGGCGRVGLPLGVSLAECGLRVALVDMNAQAVAEVKAGRMPFREADTDGPLARCVTEGKIQATEDPSVIANSGSVIVVIGTPIDDHLNPSPDTVLNVIADVRAHMQRGQLLVLRSTVYPGVTKLVEQLVEELAVDVAFCPERIAEGQAMVELRGLPQIVSARTPEAMRRARELFSLLTNEIVELSPEEAELAKLFTNAWRYIKFAAANQFFMIANEYGLDFCRIRDALAFQYPRAADMPRAGFTAGPCLLKDTMQLAAFNNNNFTLGHVSMMINEGLPLYVISEAEKWFDFSRATVGLLGMAFKGGSDDIRDSLSYKLKRILKLKAREVLCTDPYVTVDPTLSPLAEVLERASLLVIGAPHAEYAKLESQAPIIDIWGVTGQGTRV